jgi:hypothetical protein
MTTTGPPQYVAMARSLCCVLRGAPRSLLTVKLNRRKTAHQVAARRRADENVVVGPIALQAPPVGVACHHAVVVLSVSHGRALSSSSSSSAASSARAACWRSAAVAGRRSTGRAVFV